MIAWISAKAAIFTPSLFLRSICDKYIKKRRRVQIGRLTDAGVPLKVAMKKTGFSDEEIEEAIALKEKEQARQEANLAAQNRVPIPA